MKLRNNSIKVRIKEQCASCDKVNIIISMTPVICVLGVSGECTARLLIFATQLPVDTFIFERPCCTDTRTLMWLPIYKKLFYHTSLLNIHDVNCVRLLHQDLVLSGLHRNLVQLAHPSENETSSDRCDDNGSLKLSLRPTTRDHV